MPEVIAIAAVARNGVIGDGNDMLWHFPEDLRFFKQVTLGHPMIMGRATYEGLGKALPGRHTIVVTRNEEWSRDDCDTAASLEGALEIAAEPREGIDSGRVFIAGGGQVYAAALAERLLDTIIISEIPVEPVNEDGTTEGLVAFPHLDPDEWVEASREHRETFTVVTLQRTGFVP